jgi:hypothetical protein
MRSVVAHQSTLQMLVVKGVNGLPLALVFGRACGGRFAHFSSAMLFESLLTSSRPHIGTAPSRRTEALDLVLNSGAGNAYSQEAFQHFLVVERSRAHRAGRNFLLLLITLRGFRVPRGLTEPLFAGLRQCVREIDFIGWYDENRVAGAVLTQGLDMPGSDAPARIIERVTSILTQQLPREAAAGLRVRVVQLGAKTND